MAGREGPDPGPSRPGHYYQGTHVYDGGKAHFGDSYHIKVDSPLNRLPYASEAPFNSYSRQYESTCLDNTRVDILRKIFDWADGQDERYIFWLNGLAGTGKSTIARTVARKYYGQKHLGASFFFSRGGEDVGNASKFVTSIAVQLANNVPSLQKYIGEAITERTDIASQSLRDQWRQLVLGPLSKLDDNSCRSLYVLVVDALDECENENDMRIILSLFSEARLLDPVRLQIFITSRPEVPIRHGVYQIPEAEHQDFILHNISPAVVDHDITIFLEHELGFIGQERALGAGWPGGEVIQRLVQHASGLFIWAATACRFIREGKRFATKRLAMILESSRTSVTAPEKHLNEIYITVLAHSISTNFVDEEKEELYSMLRHILGSIVILSSPLSADSLSRLLHATNEGVDQTLEDLHAILEIPKDRTLPLRLHHPSFRDFLLNKDRCDDPKFWVDEEQAHRTIADNCIRLMSIALKQDICDQRRPGVLVADVEIVQIEQCLPPEIQYACLYWVQHLQNSGVQLRDNDQVHQFLLVHLLHWLEALSWMQKISEGILAIILLETIALNSDCPDLYAFIHDMKRFALYSRSAIEQAPLQTYCSALVFAPAKSIVRRQFEDCIPRWIRRLPKVENRWNALLQTLEGHNDIATSVAFSPDGKQLASASDDKTIRLWDAGSGAVLHTLESHMGFVRAVIFSTNGKLLASTSNDKTIKLWDASSGTVLQTFESLEHIVGAVAFASDDKLLAFTSKDETLKLRDISLGAVLQTLEGHSSFVHTAAFSPDGKLLASVSRDTVYLWDVGSGALLRTLDDEDYVWCLAFSPDGKVVVSGSLETVKVWDAGSGELLKILGAHEDCVVAVAFSPDGKLLASGSGDATCRLWDAGSGELLRTLESHGHWVEGLAFSPDGKLLASASHDKTVKLWDANLDEVPQTLKNFQHWVKVMVFSPDGRLLASGSYDGTVKLWDVGSGAVLQSLKGHADSVTAVAFSPDGKLLASASVDKTVKVWDADSKAVLHTLEGHTGFVRAVVFSTNGKLLASTSDDRTTKLWDASLGTVLQTFEGHEDFVRTVAFAPDDKLLASASKDETVKLWNARSGVLLQTLKGHTGAVRAVAFSPDGKLLASASKDNTVKLWDAGTGAVLHTLEVDAIIRRVLFSDDGTFLQSDRGQLNPAFLSICAPISRSNSLKSIFVKDQWVTRGTENILWLPSDYRPTEVAVYRSTVAFGYSSSRMLFLEFIF